MTGGHLLVHSFASAIAVRALSGIAGSALSTVGLLYIVQASTPALRLKSLVLAITLPQLAVPLARLFPTGAFDADHWQAMYLFELALALFCLMGVRALPLPPVERVRSFERLDFIADAPLPPAQVPLFEPPALRRGRRGEGHRRRDDRRARRPAHYAQ